MKHRIAPFLVTLACLLALIACVKPVSDPTEQSSKNMPQFVEFYSPF